MEQLNAFKEYDKYKKLYTVTWETKKLIIKNNTTRWTEEWEKVTTKGKMDIHQAKEFIKHLEQMNNTQNYEINICE